MHHLGQLLARKRNLALHPRPPLLQLRVLLDDDDNGRTTSSSVDDAASVVDVLGQDGVCGDCR